MVTEVINIASKLDARGFKQAESASAKLTKSVKNLAAGFGLAFSARALGQYSKQAVAAFAADDKAAQVLTRTLQNLGLAFSDLNVQKFISDIEKETGVLDDKLRPAFQKLLTTSSSVTESQKMLRTALDLSAASGVDLETVAADLSKAYVGQTRGLAKYGLGLSQAQLKGIKFADLQERINGLFGGQAALVADTYAGKIDKLNVQFANLQESIGKSLLDGLDNLSGGQGGGLSFTQDRFDALSASVARATDNFSRFFGAIGLGLSGQGSAALDLLNQAQGGKKPAYMGAIPSIQAELSTKVWEDRMKVLREEAKLANKVTKEKQKQLALAKAQAAEAKKKLVLDQASAVLNQANKIFDNERIQLAAAMQGKLTEEDKVRVKLKQDILNLEDAINEGNVTAAAKIASSVASGADQLGKLRGDMVSLNGIPNPFTAWLDSLRQMTLELSKLANVPIVSAPVAGFSMGGGAGYEVPTNPYAGTYYGETGRDPMPVNITISTTDQFTNALRYDLVDSSMSGSFAQLNRNVSSF